MRDAIYGVIIVAVAIVSWHVSAQVQPTYDATPRIDTVKVDTSVPDRSKPEPPDIRITHEPADIVLDTCVAAPEAMQNEPLSLVDSGPISIQGRDVTLTRFDVSARAWTQDVYRVPRKEWALSPVVSTTLSADYQAAHVGIEQRWKHVVVTPGWTWSSLGAGPSIRLKVKPFTWRW